MKYSMSAENDLNMITKIYLKILNEDLIVYRPVLANSIRENTFKIIDKHNFLMILMKSLNSFLEIL